MFDSSILMSITNEDYFGQIGRANIGYFGIGHFGDELTVILMKMTFKLKHYGSK